MLDLVNNRVLLGEKFEATLAEIETYLLRERSPQKTPGELHDNIVRQLAAQRGYLVRKSRPRLYVTSPGEYQLFRKGDLTTPILVTPDGSPTLDELEMFLRALPCRPSPSVVLTTPQWGRKDASCVNRNRI
ncbi:MAG: hypothetical protein M3Q07_13165 [Pseudobdellovibrionaceae bacterium]|nr:hypothetical protein [Pseudobdellovibrionaceae bacterium]